MLSHLQDPGVYAAASILNGDPGQLGEQRTSGTTIHVRWVNKVIDDLRWDRLSISRTHNSREVISLTRMVGFPRYVDMLKLYCDGGDRIAGLPSGQHRNVLPPLASHNQYPHNFLFPIEIA